MKRLLALLAVLLLVWLPALAEEDHVCVNAEGLQVYFALPQDTLLLTPESTMAEFMSAGFMPLDMIKYMEECSISAVAVPVEDFPWEICLHVYPSQGTGLDDMTDLARELFRQDIENQYREAGCQDAEARVFRTQGYTYMRIQYTAAYEDGSSGAFAEYVTVAGGREIWVSLNCFDDVLDQEGDNAAQAIADSLWFTEMTKEMP